MFLNLYIKALLSNFYTLFSHLSLQQVLALNFAPLESHTISLVQFDILNVSHVLTTLLDLTLQGGLEAIPHVRKFTDELKFIVNNLIRNQISSDLTSNKDFLKIYNQIEENNKDYEIPISIDLLSATTMSEISTLKTKFSNNNIYMLIIFPLVYSREETIYRMHSLPIIQQKANLSAMAYITPKSSYLIKGDSAYTYITILHLGVSFLFQKTRKSQ